MKYKFLSLLTIGAALISACNKIDYSSNQYVGSGSQYVTGADTSTGFIAMQYFFDPDGKGAIILTEMVSSREYRVYKNITYEIKGDVNVSWFDKEHDDKGSGYFVTTQSGQAYVESGVYFYRFK